MKDQTVKAKRGRPKKAAENPDCEVATRGYVKCVARKTREHTHDNPNFVLSYGVIGLASALLLSWFGAGEKLLSQINIPTVLATITIICTCTLVCGLLSSFLRTSESSDMRDIQTSQPHTEPPCEPKKGGE
jgi:uncharacterized protein YacL